MEFILLFVIAFPLAGAVISYLIGRYQKKYRDLFAEGVTVVIFLALLFLFFGVWSGKAASGVTFLLPGICGFGLSFRLDGFRILYGTVAAFMWMMSTLFSREYFAHYRNRNRYYLFLLFTLSATLGVFFSADFYTTFIFFEIMSFTSYVWVAQDERKESLRAAETYLAIAVIGGLVMLMGLFLLYDAAGTLEFEKLAFFWKTAAAQGSAEEKKLMAAGICMLFGFGAKAGAFPLHIWLPKAHPVAPAPASALLSGILTKAGVFGILALSSYVFSDSGVFGRILLFLGVCTMVTGAVLALFSIDLKRTLACSSVSQRGFIVTGIGMAGLFPEGKGLTLYGSLLHMVNHSLIKLVLFMAAGVVFMNVHKLDLNEIRGFGRKKPLLHFIFLMGALGIGGIPLWNGYISKTLLHESITEYIKFLGTMDPVGVKNSIRLMKGIELTFLVSGGLTVAYMLKLYVALFIEKNADAAVQKGYDEKKGVYMNRTSAFALTASAALLPIMGILPGKVMEPLAALGSGFLQVQEMEKVSYFSFASLKGGLTSILIGAGVYLLVVRRWMMKEEGKRSRYMNRWNPRLDLEELVYRPVLLKIVPSVCGFFCLALDGLLDNIVKSRAVFYICSVAARLLDSLTDGAVVGARKTVYKDSRIPQELEEGTAFTHALGCLAKGLEGIGNVTVFRKKKRDVDYEHRYALKYEEWTEDKFIIQRSMSFGFVLFCFGLLLTMGYLLFLR